MKNKNSQKGQAIILIVFGIMALIGFTALAIDGGNAYSDHRNAQNAADTSAFAAALAKINNSNLTGAALQTAITNAARSRASSNGYNNDGTTNTVQVINPPTSGQYTCAITPSTCNDYVQVIVTSNVKTFFAQVLGRSTITNVVQAIARAKPAIPNQPLYGGNAIVGLSTDCSPSKPAVKFCGSTQLQIWGGGVTSNANCDTSLVLGGNLKLYDSQFSTVGPGFKETGGASVSPPTVQTSVTQYAYPPTSGPAIPTCSANVTKSGSTLSVSADGTGIWNTSTYSPAGLTLNPGIYCVYGNLDLHAKDSLTGNGVTLIMENGGATWDGTVSDSDVKINLVAPTSGPTAGYVIMAPFSNTSSFLINGKVNVDLTGTVYLPGSDFTFTGSAQLQKHNVQFVVGTFDACGASDLQMVYGTSGTATNTIPPEITLAQ